MTHPKDQFFEAHIICFVREVLCKLLLVFARHAPSRAISLSGDSPSFNALETGTTVPKDWFSEAHIICFVLRASASCYSCSLGVLSRGPLLCLETLCHLMHQKAGTNLLKDGFLGSHHPLHVWGILRVVTWSLAGQQLGNHRHFLPDRGSRAELNLLIWIWYHSLIWLIPCLTQWIWSLFTTGSAKLLMRWS